MSRTRAPWSKFKKLSASHIIGKRRLVWTCKGCGLIANVRPTQCVKCGRLDFYAWDSAAEQKRWAELELMQRAGIVSELRRQVRFNLNAAGPRGEVVRVGAYVADFVYLRDGDTIIEDVKGGAITDLAVWKVRHMAAQGQPVKLRKVV